MKVRRFRGIIVILTMEAARVGTYVVSNRLDTWNDASDLVILIALKTWNGASDLLISDRLDTRHFNGEEIYLSFLYNRTTFY